MSTNNEIIVIIYVSGLIEAIPYHIDSLRYLIDNMDVIDNVYSCLLKNVPTVGTYM